MIQLEGTQTGPDTYKVTAIPKHAKPISTHRTFEAAIKAANYRGRRYNRAYCKPRGIPVQQPARMQLVPA